MVIKNITVTYNLSNGDSMKRVIDESSMGTLLDINPTELLKKCMNASEQITETCKNEFAAQGTLFGEQKIDDSNKGDSKRRDIHG